ncbi:MAG: hypothetical protein ACD_2C00122G0006 [uncultured bacterium (gcode 4)]|uniref:Uncharacterized protein n=1 Tax=uncultured bacterium (gcode 4) TaxID=1234023 RepID=K2GH03_9BACT|nr:MAG: hypothetical protein ACD_2C00122G0006 [uncultured bacterium (gcode 4)]
MVYLGLSKNGRVWDFFGRNKINSLNKTISLLRSKWQCILMTATFNKDGSWNKHPKSTSFGRSGWRTLKNLIF